MKRKIIAGDQYIEAELPENTREINPPDPLPKIADIREKLDYALNNPIAHQPLSKIVSASSKVVIAFDDASGSYFETSSPDFRRVAIEYIFEQLKKIGVKDTNVTLLCAQGLHRKLTRIEMETFLGRKLVMQFGYNRLYCHDAEDPKQLIHLGFTDRGFDVEVNKAIVEADQFIYLNSMWAPFNGGWKSTAVGLGTFKSIRHHHRPWPSSTGQSVDDPKNSSFKKLVWEQGSIIQKHLEKTGKRILAIETVYDNKETDKDLIAINAGHPTEVHKFTLAEIEKQLIVDVKGQSDILLAGISNRECYSKFSVINPILISNAAMAGTVMQFQNMPVVKKGGIAILVHPFEAKFDASKFAPYVEFYNKLLTESLDPYEIWENHVEDFAHRPEFIYGYRHSYAYHGAHPFFMWNSTSVPKSYLSDIYFAGVKDFDSVKRCGFKPFSTVEKALKAAEFQLGKQPSITLLNRPPTFIPKVN